LPGIFPIKQAIGFESIDGGWCDNVPMAPVLCGDHASPDLVFVICLEQAPFEPPPLLRLLKTGGGYPAWITHADTESVSLTGLASMMWGVHSDLLKLRHNFARGKANVPVWSFWDKSAIWPAYRKRLSGPDAAVDAPQASEDRPPTKQSAAPPRIVVVTPSQDLGGFFGGTLGFSAKKAERFMRLGEDDMNRILAQLDVQRS
jgi:hypothetical protein